MEDFDHKELNYVNNLCKEIMRECSQLGIQTTREFVEHLIKMKALNPKSGFLADGVRTRETTQKFVMSCVEDLSTDTPSLNCIRLQAYWSDVIAKLDDVKEAYFAYNVEKSEATFKDLVHVEETNKLIKKIATFCNEYTNIGNTNITLNLRETIYPLRSVFKSKDQAFFLSLTHIGKLEYLKILSRIVSGIRIYQFYFKTGSENVDDAPLLLPQATATIKTEVEEWLEKIEARIALLLRELTYLYNVDPGLAEGDIPQGFDDHDVDELKRIHHIMQQHEIYLRRLLSYLNDFTTTINVMTEDFSKAITKLHDTIGRREVIAADEVYDRFIHVCDQWSDLQAESCYLVCLGLIVKNLYAINKYFPLTRLEMVLSQTKMDTPTKRRFIHLSESIWNRTDECLEFQGFCAWTICATDGFLISAGDKVTNHGGRYYGFFSPEAAANWIKNPSFHVMRAYEVIRTNPEMVFLLDMYDFLFQLRTEILVPDEENSSDEGTQDKLIQTVTHPLSRFIDKDYTFSLWEMKFRALQLSRIIKCATKSAQTVSHSHYKSSIGLQVAPNRTQETITKKDVGSVHEAIKNYIWGLRQKQETKFSVVSLTRPVDESHSEVLKLKNDSKTVITTSDPKEPTPDN